MQCPQEIDPVAIGGEDSFNAYWGHAITFDAHCAQKIYTVAIGGEDWYDATWGHAITFAALPLGNRYQCNRVDDRFDANWGININTYHAMP